MIDLRTQNGSTEITINGTLSELFADFTIAIRAMLAAVQDEYGDDTVKDFAEMLSVFLPVILNINDGNVEGVKHD